MKAYVQNLFLAVALCAGVSQSVAQSPVINSFSQNGLLVCSGLQTGSVASVEWASSLSGPWNTNWTGLDAVTANSNGMIQVSVPMFYRVRGVAQTNSNQQFTSDGMVLIPAGTFTIGDSLDGESDALPTNITVSTFYMDTNLVSWGQYQLVYAYATNHGYNFFNVGGGKATNHPVHLVDWYDAVKWCNVRSQRAGLNPVYFTDAGFSQLFTNGNNGTLVYAKWSANGYRLPTEAEWEKAARGGLSGKRFPWGDTISENQANYFGSTNTYPAYDLGPNGHNAAYAIGEDPLTSPVGSFAPNGYGLFDMSGNVFEWCWDWYVFGIPYGQPTTTDPTGPASGANRILRGGNWNNGAYYARCATRGNLTPDSVGNSGSSYGFRCVRR